MSAPLLLIGFMAAGKTSVGRTIAARSGRRFVDLDDVIAAAAGEPVPALVARSEPAFRALEAKALGDVLAAAGDAPVIATGGGAAMFGDNLTRMRAAGMVVALGVDVTEAQRRAAEAGAGARPLMASAQQLAAQRAPVYRRAHAVVDTTMRSIDEVVANVLAAEATWRQLPAARRDATIVALGDRSYPITVTDAMDGSLVAARLAGATKRALITDRNVAGAWLTTATAALGAVEVVQIEPGEPSKSFASYQRVCNELIARGLDRTSAIIALGGGVVGDLAGFVAATLYRGIPVVHLPTTIVAMTDSAIGGKTAIDTTAGKNLVGAFWQPRLVACSLATLDSLPIRERRAGFGELWKYALLDGPELWRTVAACASWAAGASAPPVELRQVIDRAIAYKAAIVSRDERELTGHRALLNLGHTVGHAIESASDLLHGEAVGLGLIAACRVSATLCGARADLAAELESALASSGLPADLDPWLTDDVLARISVDKKRVGDKLRFVAIREVGSCEPVELSLAELRRILRPVRSP
ncbi:MAG: 3-dehydroquinate synthase [Kofleriaceae bacterium]